MSNWLNAILQSLAMITAKMCMHAAETAPSLSSVRLPPWLSASICLLHIVKASFRLLGLLSLAAFFLGANNVMDDVVCAWLQDMYKAYQVEPHVALHAPVQARPHTKFEGASLTTSQSCSVEHTA